MPLQRSNLARLLPVAIAVLALGSLSLWLKGESSLDIAARVPGTDGAQAQVADTAPVELKGELVTFDGVPADLPGDWPQFRGPNLDAVSPDPTPLNTEWAATGPPVLWDLELGEGYAGAAVLAGRVYILDYDRPGQADAYRCLSLADGKEIWRYSYPLKVKRNHGMSRTVCAVTEKYVVGLGPKCHVTCLDAKTGALKWAVDLKREYQTTVPPWYAGQCPLIDNGRAIIAPGGDDLIVAFDAETGELLWRTPNPRAWKMSHASIVPMTFDGQRMFVYCAAGGLIGVAAEDGKVLWETSEWKIQIATVPTPIVVGEGRMFLAGGYGAGSMMLQLQRGGEGITTKSLFRVPPETFGSAQQTPVFYNGYIYGVKPKGELVCLDLQGKVEWTSGAKERFGLGPYMIADGAIFVMDDDGLLTMAEATPEAYRRIARAQVLQGHEAWGPMALAGNRLLLRDLTRMVCLDLGRN